VDDLADGVLLDEEAVVTDVGLHHVDGGWSGQELRDLVLQPQRVEAIRADARDRDVGFDGRERGRDTTAARPTSWWFIDSLSTM